MFLGYQVFHSEYPYNVSQISHKGICLKKIKNKLENRFQVSFVFEICRRTLIQISKT